MKVCDAGPDLIELMDCLSMTPYARKKFLKLFSAIDKDQSGFISVLEFLVHLGLAHSNFIERCFNSMDVNAEGDSKLQVWHLTLSLNGH